MTRKLTIAELIFKTNSITLFFNTLKNCRNKTLIQKKRKAFQATHYIDTSMEI